MDLFEYMRSTNMEKEAPLAARMRPRTLDEVVGQEHIIGKDKLLYRAIKADKISSINFYGPPGTGKTTLAKVIANTTSAEFRQINATVAGKKDMEEVVAKAKELQGMYGKRTILFIDEIHRFNKGQQDYLLPYVEDGTIILIGATTENPYFEVNGALLSRSRIFELKPLEKEDIKELIRRALPDRYRRAAMVGDRRFDMEGARANGVDGLGVTQGFGGADGVEQSGAAVVVRLFNFRGMGSLMVDSIEKRDYQVIQAITLLIAMLNVFINLIIDLIYGLADPRIRLD